MASQRSGPAFEIYKVVPPDAKVQKVMELAEQAEEENKQLRALLLARKRSGTSCETPENKPSGGLASPESSVLCESDIPWESCDERSKACQWRVRSMV